MKPGHTKTATVLGGFASGRAQSRNSRPTGNTVSKQLLWRLVLWSLRVKRRDKALRCGRDLGLMNNYNILRRDFLPVDSLVCVVVRSDGRTLQRNACKQTARARIAQYFSTHRDIGFCRRVTTDWSCCYRRICSELHFAA